MMPPKAFPCICENSVIPFPACFGCSVNQRDELVFLPGITQRLYLWWPFRTYSILPLQRPHLFLSFVFQLQNSWPLHWQNRVLQESCFPWGIVPQHQEHCWYLHMEWDVLCLMKGTIISSLEFDVFLFVCLEKEVTLCLFLSLSSTLSFLISLLWFSWGSVKVLPAKFAVTLRSHRHLIFTFFFILKQTDVARCKLPGALANLVVNDSHRECFSCPWRGFRHSWGRFATINYAQF